MSVKINIPQYWFSEDEQEKSIMVNCKTAGECLKKLVSIYPEIEGKLFEKNGRLKTHIDIFINQKSAYPEDLDSKVKSGDEIDLIRLISGG